MRKPNLAASTGIFSHIAIGVVAALPFVILQMVFIRDWYQWSIFLFGYVGIVLAAPTVFAAWIIYGLVEIGVRHAASRRLFPTFAIAGGVWLIGFFSPAFLIQPLLKEIPFFCRAVQDVEWSTSMPDAKWESPNQESYMNHRFILVLIGKGTVANHKFTAGYLNWTGHAPAGFTSLRFAPVSFQEGYYEAYKTGSPEYLQSRLAKSGMPADEAEAIAIDMWQLLQQVDKGGEVQSTQGDANKVASSIADGWDLFIGGLVWIATLLGVFILVSFGIAAPNVDFQASGKELGKNDGLDQRSR